MIVEHLNHITLKCRESDLGAVKAFYTSVLGLTEGPRPAFSFAGDWLYSAGQPIVHLAALLEVAAKPDTGPLDHIAFSGRDLAATREMLARMNMTFDETPVPGFPLHQIFLKDPLGLKVELTFRTDALEA